MEFDFPLFEGALLRRYKRFLADVRLTNGKMVTAHCPNSGSMKGLSLPGSSVLLWESANPRRKLRYTWELVKTDGVWVGINTNRPTRLVTESLGRGEITELAQWPHWRREVTVGESRLDLLLETGKRRCWVELKNVTLVEKGVAMFPDAITARGQKHLRELVKLAEKGDCAAALFVVQREDVHSISPADDIDPEFGRQLRRAREKGVAILAYKWRVSPEGIFFAGPVPVKMK